MIEDPTLQKIAHASQRAALLSFAVFVGLVIYGSYQLYSVRKSIAELKVTQQQLVKENNHLAQKALEIAGKLASFAPLSPQLNQDLQNLIRIANSQKNGEGATFLSAITPRASATPRPGVRTPDGGQVYDFKCWIEGPEEVKSQISDVTYYFDDPSFKKKEQDSSDASKNFGVGYLGWGALHVVPIKIRLKNGSEYTLYFDMYNAVGWGS